MPQYHYIHTKKKIKEEDGGIHYFEERHKYDIPCGSILRLLKYPKVGAADSAEIVRAGR
jgi:hypothetical protein